MKTKIISLGFLLSFFCLLSCDEDIEKVMIKETIEANQLQSLSASSFVLTIDKGGDTFQEFTWTAPDYGFAAAESFVLQMDLASANFENALDIATTQTTSATLKVEQINKLLLDLGIEPEKTGVIALRVRTTINDNVEPVYSNTVTASMTPYATEFPPVYMIGDATGGWDLGKAVKMLSVAPSKYSTTALFTNGGKFRFFAAPSWDAAQFNWSSFSGGTVDVNLQDGQDGDGNFVFAGTTGWYKITADTKNKTIALESTEQPRLYMIGAAIEGWDLSKAVELERLEDGVFKGPSNFTSGETFRFFTAPDWAKGTINFTYFDGGNVDPLFVNANDGDKNFKFTGETGEYTITVDLNTKTVVMETGTPKPIYMIGDATGGWDLTKAVEIANIGTLKYETIAAFTNGGKFRFFVEPDWNALQYKWITFTGGNVDNELEDGADGDGNFKFVGDSGSYKITVDVANKTIVMELQ